MKISSVFALLTGLSGVIALGLFLWIYVEGTVLGSSDPNIGGGILLLLSIALTVIFAVLWAGFALYERAKKRRNRQ
ncbi:hypothetical protein HF984_06290 [Rothia terrae]|uniref:hypothetical protein n=1 Tax=Rothia terrae TaxID=396015 RepID=UPI00144787AD|nr:hypothetical protein [Rothia terrae]MDT0189935.1 hypothetical protein [Rothia terrae]NKZ34375.1 hypothetical protein [Rothia terrae]